MKRLACALTSCALTGLAACSQASSADRQPVTVLAAVSLTDALTAVAADYESDRPDSEIQLSFAASSTLVQQVNQGAGADVLALAGTQPLDHLDSPDAGEPTIFATNALQIVVPADNPAQIQELADLDRTGLTLVACEPQVPCGSAAQDLFSKNTLAPAIASYEKDVRATLTKVALGEADAGVVYRTDVAAANPARVRGIDISAEANVINDYPILTVSSADVAREFVDFVRSERGQERLAEHGFGPP